MYVFHVSIKASFLTKRFPANFAKIWTWLFVNSFDVSCQVLLKWESLVANLTSISNFVVNALNMKNQHRIFFKTFFAFFAFVLLLSLTTFFFFSASSTYFVILVIFQKLRSSEISSTSALIDIFKLVLELFPSCSMFEDISVDIELICVVVPVMGQEFFSRVNRPADSVEYLAFELGRLDI